MENPNRITWKINRAILVAAVLAWGAAIAPATAQHAFWINTSTGVFSDLSNWDRNFSGRWSDIFNGGTALIEPGMSVTPYGLTLGTGSNAPTAGFIRMTGGRLTTSGQNTIFNGSFLMSGGEINPVTPRNLDISNATGGVASCFTLSGGTAVFSTVIMSARAGVAFTLDGDPDTTRAIITNGLQIADRGNPVAPNGVLNLTRGSLDMGGKVWVDGSVATKAGFAIRLGDAAHTPVMTDLSSDGIRFLFFAPSFPSPSYVINVPVVIQGWGTPGWKGSLDFGQGRIIADGWGSPENRTLDLTHLGTGSSAPGVVVADRAGAYGPHRAGATNGWFAQNKAQLLLPDLPVTTGSPVYTWGDDQTEGTALDLINSLQIAFHNVTSGGTLAIALLAADRDELGTTPDATATAGGLIRGVWKWTTTGLAYDTADLQIRYDASDLSTEQEDALAIFQSIGTRWVDVSTLPGVTLALNTASNTIAAAGLQDLSYIAVGTDIRGRLAAGATAGTVIVVR